jgi:hypothetical protein
MRSTAYFRLENDSSEPRSMTPGTLANRRETESVDSFRMAATSRTVNRSGTSNWFAPLDLGDPMRYQVLDRCSEDPWSGATLATGQKGASIEQRSAGFPPGIFYFTKLQQKTQPLVLPFQASQICQKVLPFSVPLSLLS